MKNQNKKSENGQIIVLLAVSLVVVIMVASLAIDGGMIYSERRFAQNAADASSLAGGGEVLQITDEIYDEENAIFICPDNSSYNSSYDPNDATSKMFLDTDNLIAKAVIKAKQNAELQNNVRELPFLGYFKNGSSDPIDGKLDDNSLFEDNHGIIVECNSASDILDKYIDVKVRVTSQISTAFAHLIFKGDVKTTNESVTRTVIGHNLGYGNAIISLSGQCKENNDGMYFSGNNTVSVSGGSIYSNSCLDGDGNVTVKAGTVTQPQGIYLTYPFTEENKPSFTPAPSTVTESIKIIADISRPPECNKQGELDTSTNTYLSGYYPDIKINNGTYTFENGGKFCFTGSSPNTFEITGGTVTGDNVFFYVESGNVRITGKATVKFTSQSDKTKAYYGLLLYMPEENEGLITLVGNDESLFSGTVYAPKGYIEAGGTSTMCETNDDGFCDAETFSTQLIGWYVKITGTSDIDILFDNSKSYWINGNFFLLQ